MKKYGVYVLKENNTIRYIGSGIIKDRIYRHHRGDTEIGRYLNSLGISIKDTYEIVFESNERSECYNYEERLSKSVGLVSEGGTIMFCNQHGYSASEDKRKKIADNHADFSGSNNPNYKGKWHGTQYRKPVGVPCNKWWTNDEVRVKCTKLEKPEGFYIIQPRSKVREKLMSLPIKELKDL